MRVTTNQRKPNSPSCLAWPAFLAAALLLPASPAAADFELPDWPAKEALALMLDNQNRCYHLADAYRVQMDKHAGKKFGAEKAATAFVDNEGDRLETVNYTLRKIGDLIERAEGGVDEATHDSLDEMYKSQTALYGVITQFSAWEHRTDFDAAVSKERKEFNVARSRVAETLHLSAREHREISDDFAKRLELIAAGSGDGPSDAEKSDPLVREMTASEYRKKQEEYQDWLAEQERIRNERLRRRQERQQQILARESERKANPAAGAMPSVKLQDGVDVDLPAPPPAAPEAPSSEMLAAMKAWHPRYNHKVFPFKSALGQYLQIKKTGSPRQLGHACGKMSEALAPLLADEKVMNAPDPDVAKALEISMTYFKKGADICRHQPDAEQVARHFGTAEKALTAVANGLKRYWLPL